jgi:hypothetical protein
MYRKFAGAESNMAQSSAAQPPAPTRQNVSPKQPPTYTVTAGVNPAGGGSVAFDPNKAAYNAGEQLTMTATPSGGYAFTGWSGDVFGTVNPGAVTVNNDMALTANFLGQDGYGTGANDTAVKNFTAGERVGTWFLNWLVPGVGSATIMKDREGAGVQLGLAGVGFGLVCSGIAMGVNGAVIGTSGLFILGTNFPYNIFRSITYDRPGSQNNKFDMYLAPKYQFPMGTPVSWGGINVEIGVIWGNGAFVGLDGDCGLEEYDAPHVIHVWHVLGGGGLSLGNVYDFGNQIQFVYGMSAGYWFGENFWYKRDEMDETQWVNSSYRYDTFNFLAPFIKLRWRFLELKYRGLVGFWEETHGDYHRRGDGDNSHIEKKDGFGLNNHQLMLGLYFATNKRQR